MSDIPAPEAESVTAVEIEAVIIRADGTREPLGLVDTFYKNPFRRAWWALAGRPASNRRIHAANNRAAVLAKD